MQLPHVLIIIQLILSLITAVRCQENSSTDEDSDICNSSACHQAAQILLGSLNSSADPCHDFFLYACGGWIDKHPIPQEKSHHSAFDNLNDDVKEKVAELLKTAAYENHPKPVLSAATLFLDCADEDAREIEGLAPLKKVLNSFGGWPMMTTDWSEDGYQWHVQVANALRTLYVPVVVTVYVGTDSKNSSQHMIILTQAGFGLGRNELIKLTSSEHTIEAYRNYLISSAKLLNPNANDDQLRRDVEELIQFESALAKLSRPLQEKKSSKLSTNNKMTVSEVDRVTENTHFKWSDFLNIVFQDSPIVTDETQIIIQETEYIKNAIKLLQNTNSRTAANYIGWYIVKALGPQTTKDFRDTAFHFWAALRGVKKQVKLETECIGITSVYLGFAVGRLYVDNYFPEETKRDVDQMVEDIRSAFEVSINHNTWMDHETKIKALQKLRSMISMMGYPPWIKNDTELIAYYQSVPDLRTGEYFESLVKVRAARTGIILKKWNQPTERETEWVTSPSVVNAFFSPPANTITFPAGILDLPFYQYGRLPVLNYGAIGSVIGHEISHGYDVSGSQYDSEGNLVNWWSNQTRETFEEKSNCFRTQYSSYVEPTTNMKLNGNNTVADDIADNGGVRNAFFAYEMRVLQSQNKAEEENKRLPGMTATPKQLFFLSYANVWCGHSRKETTKNSIQYSSHSPGQFRINVPLTNAMAFADAFSCPLGSPMNPEYKCELW